ncbi:hypothetical protein C8F01DRAFT_1042896 [Mycena amicta]|nr:hypothetical protein C8F01DRAFT_1042896 [Mycena amicta]
MDSTSRAANRVLLSNLEEEIHRIESNLAALLKKRDDIRNRLDQYKYPVLTLPDEIATEIFTQYLPQYPLCPPSFGPGSPTHLLGVCRLWRSIALDSPTLWRAIGLESQALKEGYSNMVMKTWLQRSGSSLLSLQVDFETVSGPEADEELLQTVVAHRARWEYVYFRFKPSQINTLSGDAPTLVNADMAAWQNDASLMNSIHFRNTPRLRSLCLWDVGYNADSFPWSQLTTLTFMHAKLADCAPVLEHATNLHRCKLVLQTASLPERAEIRLPRLQTLVLLDNLSHAADCLARFTLPSLRNLEVSGQLFPVEAADAVVLLQSFLTRSRCRLNRLRICGPSSLGSIATACRNAVPNLKVVAAERPAVFNDIDWKTDEYWADEASFDEASSSDVSL